MKKLKGPEAVYIQQLGDAFLYMRRIYEGIKTGKIIIHEPIQIRDISASDYESKKRFKLRIIGESNSKIIFTQFNFTCSCGYILEKREIPEHIIESQVFLNNDTLIKKLIKDEIGHSIQGHFNNVDLLEPQNYAELFVVDYFDSEEITEFKEIKYKTVHLLENKAPNSKLISFSGKVTRNPKNKELTIIGSKIKAFEDDLTKFKLTDNDIDELNKNFRYNLNVLNDLEKSISPELISLQLEKIGALLTAHSALRFKRPDGKITWGLLRAVYYGDTKTGKSTIINYLGNQIKILRIGKGETGSRAGLLYTVDTDANTLIWGFLPQQDCKMVAVDGFQKLYGEEWGEFREALEQNMVDVKKKVSGVAPCRVRLIACANPKGNTLTEDYKYRCSAIREIRPLKEAPDITRFPIFFSFAHSDVSFEAKMSAKTHKPKISHDTIRKSVKWAWTRKIEQIKFEPGIDEKIENLSIKLANQFRSDSIPLIHSGFKDVYYRITVAFAMLYHSSDEIHSDVFVNIQHAFLTYRFLKQMYKKLELDKYISEEKDGCKINMEELIDELGQVELEILKIISIKPLNKKILATKLKISENTIRRHANTLKNFDLIKSGNYGYKITTNGLKFIKEMNEKPEQPVQTNLEKLLTPKNTEPKPDPESLKELQKQIFYFLDIGKSKESIMEKFGERFGKIQAEQAIQKLFSDGFVWGFKDGWLKQL